MRNGFGRICRRNENAVGQVRRDFHIVITKSVVLVGIEYFKKRRRRVALNACRKFVYLVKKNDRVFRFCLNNRRDNASGHCSDVCLSVASYICFVAYSAEGNAHEFSSERPCDGFRNRRFADAGRSDKAEYLTFKVGRELFYRDIFENSVFDFFESVVVGVEDFSRLFNRKYVFGLYACGIVEHGVEIAFEHRVFRRAERHFRHAVVVFEQFFLYFFGKCGFLYLCKVFVILFFGACVAEFVLYYF